MGAPDLLTDLLRDVSRTFYQTLRILPAPVRRPIGLAYLLARATDTIADTGIIAVADRLAALERLRRRLLGHTQGALDLSAFRGAPGTGDASDAEHALLARINEALGLLDAVDPADRQLIRAVLATITSGQVLDLERFGAATAAAPVALETEEQMEDYTYRVAGCVGEFWTRICRARLFPTARLDDGTLLALGVRFGQGLQLVNILRDLPKDLRAGRCYVPSTRLAAHGLTLRDLLDPAAMPRFRMLYDDYLALADACLVDGWAYTNALPAGQMRVRLACAWPILIGVRTLARLRTGNVLDARERIKISRRDVKRIVLRSLWNYPWPRAWNRMFERARLAT